MFTGGLCTRLPYWARESNFAAVDNGIYARGLVQCRGVWMDGLMSVRVAIVAVPLIVYSDVTVTE